METDSDGQPDCMILCEETSIGDLKRVPTGLTPRFSIAKDASSWVTIDSSQPKI